ncbi:RcgA family putative transporter [Neorhizobium sp. DAR64872/K0K18]|uniref:RcgA family putative transporter n=1 Tax=Neorhizobium sp. DAR64872/K0K18 TaxID=3421958 RepID=UPI003D28C6A1
MEKNGKFFIAPPKDGRDFKELFKDLAAAGAGRPLDSDGFPSGPWTPELLAEAISQIDSNHVGVDLRTVQLWFQENDKGVSAANIRWLARVFGCADKQATSEWQMELSAAQSRLVAKRRDSKKADSRLNRIPDVPLAELEAVEIVYAAQGDAQTQKPRFSLGRMSEAVFTRGSPLNLPASVFAGASALGFLAYILGIHSAIYTRADGIVKQVGFLWAPNWTFLFMVLLPVFFVLVTELLVYWKNNGRMVLAGHGDRIRSNRDWEHHLKAYSYSYWAVFVICIPFAGIFQWIAVDLIPLLKGGGDYAISWGTLALIRPEVVSVPMSIVFTGLAYLYMCLCFYLLFAGLILLHTILHDLWTIEGATQLRPDEFQRDAGAIALRVMEGIFRCTTVGILVAICMKLQSAYLASNGKDIVTWLVNDSSVVIDGYANGRNGFHYRMPTQFSSLLVAISSCVGFLFGSVRFARRFHMPLWRMSAVVALLFATYMLIDAFDGFSILLGIATLLATYALFDPEFGRSRADEIESDQRVS